MPPKRVKKPQSTPTSEKPASPAASSATSNVTSAEAAKSRGNVFFASNNFAEAVTSFTEAISYDNSNHIYFSNRSAAYLGLVNAGVEVSKNSLRAVSDAKSCIELNKTWSKGYSRLGAALFKTGALHDSVAAFAQGLAYDPTNASLLEGLQMVQAALTGSSPSTTQSAATVNSVTSQLNQMSAPSSQPSEPTINAAPVDPENQVVVGIDLGTTFSAVGVWMNGRVEIIPDKDGSRVIPSYVAFTSTGERLIGHAAKNAQASNPYNTLYDIKRIIGQKISDASVNTDIKRFPFTVKGKLGDEDVPCVEVCIGDQKRMFAPEEISAMVLGRLKESAEEYLGHKIKKAVITVPAYFNDAQRQATKNAGAIAGLDVQRIINEPTAAALAYGLDLQGHSSGKGFAQGTPSHKILVFDLGGGTFDVSLLSIEEGIFEVLATAGDTHLGGEDFDNELSDFLISEFHRATKSAYRTLLNESAKALKRVRRAAEGAKIDLSSSAATTVEIENLIDGIDLSVAVTRSKFEQLNQKLFDKCLSTVKRVLKDANCKSTDVNEIVLVGGSTRIPKIQQMLSEMFGGKELCKSINPDESVAYGAAVQGAILSGVRHAATNSLVLLDVTPLSLGIETEGKVMATIIKRNTSIPCRKSDTFTTVKDNQDSVDVCIYEGERPCTTDNNLLGEFVIHGIERAKAGVPKVTVTFALDANGILHVTACDTATGSSAHTTITSSNRQALSKDQIDQMIKDADRFKVEDDARRARTESRNSLEGLVYRLSQDVCGLQVIPALQAVLDIVDETKKWLEESKVSIDLGVVTMAMIEEKRTAVERICDKAGLNY